MRKYAVNGGIDSMEKSRVRRRFLPFDARQAVVADRTISPRPSMPLSSPTLSSSSSPRHSCSIAFELSWRRRERLAEHERRKGCAVRAGRGMNKRAMLLSRSFSLYLAPRHALRPIRGTPNDRWKLPALAATRPDPTRALLAVLWRHRLVPRRILSFSFWPPAPLRPSARARSKTSASSPIGSYGGGLVFLLSRARPPRSFVYVAHVYVRAWVRARAHARMYVHTHASFSAATTLSPCSKKTNEYTRGDSLLGSTLLVWLSPSLALDERNRRRPFLRLAHRPESGRRRVSICRLASIRRSRWWWWWRRRRRLFTRNLPWNRCNLDERLADMIDARKRLPSIFILRSVFNYTGFNPPSLTRRERLGVTASFAFLSLAWGTMSKAV